MRRPTMPARIARLSVMGVLGLFLTYSCGVYTSGTMIIYCAFLELYCRTIKSSRALMRLRIKTQFVGVPITALIQYLLTFIPGIPAQPRLFLGACISIPLLLTINYKFKLGFTEISQLVIVALITGTFQSNRMYFAYRLFFTTAGILISYVSFVWVFPVRYDFVYEENISALRRAVSSLCERYFGSPDAVLPDLGELEKAAALELQAQTHLDIIRDDIDLKRQYRGYRERLDYMTWEIKTLRALREILSCFARLPVQTEFSAHAFHAVAAVWNQLQPFNRERGFQPGRAVALEPLRFGAVKSGQDAELAHLLAGLLDLAAALPLPANPSPLEAEGATA